MIKKILFVAIVLLWSVHLKSQIGRIALQYINNNSEHHYINIYKDGNKIKFCEVSPGISHWVDTVVNNDTVRIPKIEVNEECDKFFGPYKLYKIKDSIFASYYDVIFKSETKQKLFSLSRQDTVSTKDLLSPFQYFDALTTYVKDTTITLKKSGKKRDCYLFNRLGSYPDLKQFIGVILVDKKSLIPIVEIYIDKKSNEYHRREAEYLNL